MNKLTKSILCVSGFIFVMAVAASLTAPHVIAQIKAALVQDIDNPARHLWTFANYDSATYTVPMGQTLVIEEVSCLIPPGNTIEIAIDELSVANRGYFEFSPSYSGGITIAEHTRIYVRAGQTFTIRSTYKGNLISLHGYLLNN